VTDADLVLGYLAPDSFLGGDMRLDVERARDAIHEAVAKPLRMSLEEAAYSIHRVVNANMARAAKVHCLEHGKDPRRFTLLAYGGAGPVHAYGVAELLGATELLYPLRAGVLSALGFLVAEPSFEVVRGRIGPLQEPNPDVLDAMLAHMQSEAARIVRGSVPGAKRLKVAREVAVRYEGQSHELYVPCPAGPLTPARIERIARDFAAAYAARYHPMLERTRMEAVRWRVRVSVPADARQPQLARSGSAREKVIKGKRRVYVAEAGRFVSCPVYDRYALPARTRIVGPAVIEERESTVYLGPRAQGVVTPRGDLRVRISGKGASARTFGESVERSRQSATA
jgi:N-methylhydantoinase A